MNYFFTVMLTVFILGGLMMLTATDNRFQNEDGLMGCGFILGLLGMLGLIAIALLKIGSVYL